MLTVLASGFNLLKCVLMQHSLTNFTVGSEPLIVNFSHNIATSNTETYIMHNRLK